MYQVAFLANAAGINVGLEVNVSNAYQDTQKPGLC
jgi:hypothetical protein